MRETLGSRTVNAFKVGQECTVRIHKGRGKEQSHPATVAHVSRDGVRVTMHGETVWFTVTYPDAKRIVKWEVTPAEALTSGELVRYVLEPLQAEVTS